MSSSRMLLSGTMFRNRALPGWVRLLKASDYARAKYERVLWRSQEQDSAGHAIRSALLFALAQKFRSRAEKWERIAGYEGRRPEFWSQYF